MKRLLILILLLVSVNAYGDGFFGGGFGGFGGGGSGGCTTFSCLAGIPTTIAGYGLTGVVQAYNANLTTYAGITPSANAQTLFGYTFAQMLTAMGALPFTGTATPNMMVILDGTGANMIAGGTPVVDSNSTADSVYCRNSAGAIVACGLSGATVAGTTSPVLTVTSDATKITVVSNVSTYMGANVQSVNETSEAATCNWANGSTCVIAGEANTTAWTLTMSNPVSGQVYRIYVTQQTSGPVPLPTFSPTVTWVSSAPTFSGTNTKHDAITCQYVGTTYFCGSIGDNF